MNQFAAEEIRKIIEQELQKPAPDWQVIETASRRLVENDPDNVRFTVDAGHIQRLGAELVGKQDTALSELIKNAFDADATIVNLIFSDHSNIGGSLKIIDDGSGMDDETIRSTWMRISTSSKMTFPLSLLYSRVRAGRKGIGRFSAQRLGKRLMLETRPRGSTSGYKVSFNWDEEFRAGRNLSDVFNRFERFDKSKDDCGTVLEISDLRDAWPSKAIARVWRSVLLLQPPFPTPRKRPHLDREILLDPGFSVVINGRTRAEQQNEISIEKSFLSQAIARIAASIDEDGRATVRVISPKLDLDDSQIFDKPKLTTGPLLFSAHYFIYLPSTLSGMTQAVAGEMGRTYGGVRIYRNGFRVLPYGEASDDWLELDLDVSRRVLLVPGNNRNFFGQVELSTTENLLFEETSSREGLLENTAYHELKEFVRSSVEWAALRVAAARNRKQHAGQPNFVAEQRRPSEFLREAIQELDKESEASQHRLDTHAVLAEAEALAANFEQKVDQDRAAALEYEEMLRLLASLGLSISVFGHEVKGAKDSLAARIDLLGDAIEAVADSQTKQDLAKQHRQILTASDRIFDIGGYISGLMSSTESRELRTLSVRGALTRFADQFSAYMKKQGVSFDIYSEPLELRTTLMHASELDSVLLNFLTNSIKSMRQNKVVDRRVRIDAKRVGRHVVIGFEDNGPGVLVENRSRVFDAFFTTTMMADDDGVTGPGTGLGLKIVADIATSYGGEARVTDPSVGYGSRFEFRILAAEDSK